MEKEILKEILKYIEKLVNPSENLLEILIISQTKAGGLIPFWLQKELSEILNIDIEEIKETIEFFPFLRENIDKKKVEICIGLSCYMGGNSIFINTLQEKLDENSEIVEKECQEACEYGPRISIGDKKFQFVSEEDLEEIIEFCKIDSSNI